MLAWELLTKDYALDKKRLLITVYADDDEAARLWRKISGFPDEKIIRIAGSDNFWSMGELGPCGPCSEIFYDHGPSVKGGPPGSPDAEGDRFVEIWNLVFMQYEQVAADKRIDLPQPSIDTGMGLERIAAVLQGTHDNYEIDLFLRADRSLGLAHRRSRQGRGQAKPPRHRRSFARGLLPHRRRRAAVERGTRLCAPPHHAPRHASRASARRRGASAVAVGADARHRDGPRLPRARARPEPHRRDAEARGDPLPRYAGARASPARRGDARH